MKNILTAEVAARRWSPQANRSASDLLHGLERPDEFFPLTKGSPCLCVSRRLKQVTVVVVESRTIVRQGLGALLAQEKGIKIEGEAQDGQQAVELAGKFHPDTVIISGNLAFRNRMEIARHIRQVAPSARIILLVREGDDAYLKDAASVGVAGVFTEQVSGPKLADAVRSAQKGGAVLSQVPEKPREESSSLPKLEVELTARQRQILRLIAEGNANKQTAADLSISIKTVEKHRQGLMTKLGIHETAGLTRYAIAAGIVTFDPNVEVPLNRAPQQNSGAGRSWLATPWKAGARF